MSAALKSHRDTRPAGDTLVVRDAESLRTWRELLRTTFWSRHLPIVRFEVPALAADRNRTLSAHADNYRKACGCTSAGFFMSAAVVATIASYVLFGGRLAAIGLREIAALVAIAAAALIIGRAWGLLWARWRLLELAADVSAAFDDAAQQKAS